MADKILLPMLSFLPGALNSTIPQFPWQSSRQRGQIIGDQGLLFGGGDQPRQAQNPNEQPFDLDEWLKQLEINHPGFNELKRKDKEKREGKPPQQENPNEIGQLERDQERFGVQEEMKEEEEPIMEQPQLMDNYVQYPQRQDQPELGDIDVQFPEQIRRPQLGDLEPQSPRQFERGFRPVGLDIDENPIQFGQNLEEMYQHVDEELMDPDQNPRERDRLQRIRNVLNYIRDLDMNELLLLRSGVIGITQYLINRGKNIKKKPLIGGEEEILIDGNEWKPYHFEIAETFEKQANEIPKECRRYIWFEGKKMNSIVICTGGEIYEEDVPQSQPMQK